jgi:predicted ATPase
MLTELSLTNYKCFNEKHVFPLSKVNLFTGLNGRGKSSMLQPILLMSQTVNQTQSLKDLLISSFWLKLGNFEDIKSSNAGNNTIKFGFKSDVERLNSFEFEYIEKENQSDKGTLNSFSLNGEKSMEETPTQPPEPRPDLISPPPEPIPIQPPEPLSDFYNESFSNNISINYWDDDRILKIFENVHYVSADRNGPQLYVDKFGILETGKTGIHGENAIKILSIFQEPLNPHLYLSGEPADLLALCEQWMNYIFDGAAMKINDNKDNSVLSLVFNPQKQGILYKTVNVGFGYSYILSLIITCLIAKKDDIVIFENPEAHLHPKAQSRLTHLLAKLAQSGVQLFIETHSEHILNGFRVMIANKNETFTNTMFNVFYFDENFQVTKLNVQTDGFIENWPSGFFDQNELDMTLLFRYSREK